MKRSLITQIVIYVGLACCSVVMLAPLAWLVSTSFTSKEAFFSRGFFPPIEHITLDNFRHLLNEVDFVRLMANSLFISGTTVMCQLFFSSLAGFALAKYEFRGKRAAMVLMLATMMIPAQVLMAPLYELLCKAKLTDTYMGLIVPGLVSVFGIFLFRQSMLRIPDDLLQAARIDGCSEFGLYWRIALPVSRPMIGAFCLVSFMAAWNNFLWPQIILHTRERFTLPIGLTQLVGLQQQDYPALMAGTLLSILPVAILFFVLQKEFIQGLTAGAVKG